MASGSPSYPLTLFAVLVCIMSAAALGLGVADVIIGYFGYYKPKNCPGSNDAICNNVAMTLTWVAVGIWSSIPLFITGIVAVCVPNNQKSRVPYFAFLAFLSAFIFGPAMTIISDIEIWKSIGVFYNLPLSSTKTLVSGHPTSDAAKFVIPLVIAIIGFLLTLVSFTAMIWSCCACGCPGSPDASYKFDWANCCGDYTKDQYLCDWGCCATCCDDEEEIATVSKVVTVSNKTAETTKGAATTAVIAAPVAATVTPSPVVAPPAPVTTQCTKCGLPVLSSPAAACTRCGEVLMSTSTPLGVVYSGPFSLPSTGCSHCAASAGESGCQLCSNKLAIYNTPTTAYTTTAFIGPTAVDRVYRAGNW